MSTEAVAAVGGSAGVTVRVSRVTHGRRADDVPVLDEVSLTARAGEIVVLHGRSGSGKSTLCHLVAGLEPPDRGEVEVLGRPATEVRDWSRVSLLPQRFGLPPELSVAENVLLPCWMHERAEPEGLLESFDLARLAGRATGELSRGEQQRVAVARAAVLAPDVLVLDEPSSNQDADHAEHVEEWLLALAAAGSTVVVATHDPRLVAATDQVIALQGGRVVN